MPTDGRVLPFADSLCHRCVHLRVIESGKGSVFLMCREPSLPKYPPQPVRLCSQFSEGLVLEIDE